MAEGFGRVQSCQRMLELLRARVNDRDGRCSSRRQAKRIGPGLKLIPVLLPGANEQPELPMFLNRLRGWICARGFPRKV